MATFDKRPNGKWRAQVRRQGMGTASRNFVSKKAAEKWTSCLVPRSDGIALCSDLSWRKSPWDKFYMTAPRPRTPSELQYSDRKLRSRTWPGSTGSIKRRFASGGRARASRTCRWGRKSRAPRSCPPRRTRCASSFESTRSCRWTIASTPCRKAFRI